MELILPPARIAGRIAAIPSKSQAHRLLICAALANRTTRLACGGLSEDIEATVRCLNAMSAAIDCRDGVFTVRPLDFAEETGTLDCGESGSTLRFLLPVAAALGLCAEFKLHGRLPQRPLSSLWEEMEAHACTLSRPAPDVVRCEGRLHAGVFRLPGDVSSQFISGLLFALPLLPSDSEILLTSPVQSRGYINLTLHALAQFGIAVEETPTGWRVPGAQRYRSPGNLAVEGDWSNAAFWLCAGAVSGPVTVTGLDLSSPQGDRAILDVLRRFGARVDETADAVTVLPEPLTGCTVDVSDIPDLAPPIAFLAACARGESRITGAARLRIKESDRLKTIAQTLHALGGTVQELPDGLVLSGGTPLHGGLVSSHNDHRIAMLAALAACACTAPVTLRGAEAVKKSYPRFWADYRSLTKGESA